MARSRLRLRPDAGEASLGTGNFAAEGSARVDHMCPPRHSATSDDISSDKFRDPAKALIKRDHQMGLFPVLVPAPTRMSERLSRTCSSELLWYMPTPAFRLS
jgi:hypothetical protein